MTNIYKLIDWLIRNIVVPFLPTYERRHKGYVGKYKCCKLNHKIYMVSFNKEK